jgi:hypothetical protein
MYRTGDRGRRREDGSLAYLGRRDRQAKVRGYRVEPAEIEDVLGRHPDIVSVRVVIRTDGPDGGRLVAYAVPAAGSLPSAEVLRKYASEFLPDFMVASAFVSLAALPLTPNGKLDESALPAPPDQPPGPGDRDEAPRAGTEQLVADVWTETLGLSGIGRNDDFFALGGHSMTAIRTIARLKKTWGPVITTKAIYRHSRLGAFAAYLNSLPAEADDTE